MRMHDKRYTAQEPTDRERKERERETAGGAAAEGGFGKGERERMGWGPIVARNKRFFGGVFGVAMQLVSDNCLTQLMSWHFLRLPYCKKHHFNNEKSILRIALDSFKIVQMCSNVVSVQLPRHTSVFTMPVPAISQNLISFK